MLRFGGPSANVVAECDLGAMVRASSKPCQFADWSQTFKVILTLIAR